MGSAPFSARRHARQIESVEPPQRARRERVGEVRARARGAAEIRHHCIHCAGAARKSCGAASARSMPVVIGSREQPDQAHVVVQRQPRHADGRSRDRGRGASTIASRFAVTQRCGSITPRGSDVEPLVYCRIASAFGIVGRPCVRAGRVPRRPSSASSSTIGGSPGAGSRNSASCASTTTSARRTRGCEPGSGRRTPRSTPSRIGSGSITVAAPHNHVAWIAVTSGRVVGPRIATCVPGATPRAWRAAAMRARVVVELGPRHPLLGSGRHRPPTRGR